MATAQGIASALSRLQAHCSNRKTDEELIILASDWARMFASFPDETLSAAIDTCVIATQFFPSTTDVLSEVQAQRRIEAGRQIDPRRMSALADRSGYTQERYEETGRIGLQAIRLQVALGLPPARDFAEMRERVATMTLPPRSDGSIMEAIARRAFNRGVEQSGGHDHRRGVEHCPICGPHDHSDANWRETCPACGVVETDDEMLSTCSGCDGSHFVHVDDGTGPNTVRPCVECNRRAYDLWVGGHYVPGHRCEVCAPTRRRREIEE